MDKESWEVVDEVSGDLQAEILGGLLEAQGLQVWLSQEGAGRAYGLNLGELGRVHILVPNHQAGAARQILEQYYAGELEGVELDPRAVEEIEDNEPGPDDE